MKVDNKRQPIKASMNPGSFKGNAAGSGAKTRPDASGGVTGKKQPAFGTSNNPGEFISLEAGADPNRKAEHDNGPRGDASATSFQVGDGQKKRTVTSVCQSPYDVK